MDGPFDTSEQAARELDASDPLAGFRDRFAIPPGPGGEPSVYLVGNSLGCMPRAAREIVRQELDDWERLGVEGHLHARRPWYSYHELLREPMARLVGARPDEVVAMNSLTVNLHLMMATFYRPRGRRTKILIENDAFPSDSYAVQSQIRHHGLDPAEHLVRLRPRPGERTLEDGHIVEQIQRLGDELALALLPGVNYLTGQWLDMERVTAACHNVGALAGWDLAHAAGNVPMRLHDWGADFAAWCSYKYLNGGSGAIAGCFVHERHARDTSLPRLAGWWGNDPKTRFEMGPDFVPVPRADAWALSNPPILSSAPLVASLALFDETGVDALRDKSVRLTSYMEQLLRQRVPERVRVITPGEADRRGCQLSLAISGSDPTPPAATLRGRLKGAGVLCDFRRPDVIRAASAPLYNSFTDVWTFVDTLARELD